MANILQLMPMLEGEELVYVQGIIKDMTDSQAQQFANIYNVRRKDPQTILLVTLIGFLGVAGIQRFLTNQIGMGLLYLFTGGLCVIGTIVDLVSYRRIAFECNYGVAQEIAVMVKASS
ncbi:MAG TPA: TM2 domain-containing protein [Candidatus Acidoferrales bacterium]|nr:TM2 domain-containing protein [Candidatus Acidoferrales bacterium]